MSSSARTSTQQNTQTAECTTVGCRNTPVGAGYCAVCIRVSPNLVEDTNVGLWDGVDFSLTQSGEWPSYVAKREQWMGRRGKRPFAPWGDSDAPALCSKPGHGTATDCGCDARWKWGYRGHYKELSEIDKYKWHCLDEGMVFIQRDEDPIVFVDGDDVRCPETGALHPDFLGILNELGLTYADVSQSGSGVHAVYRGDLPDAVTNGCAEWDLDDKSFGANNDAPTIEIYSGKHVCVMTGKHVVNSKGCACKWDDDALYEVLNDAGQLAPSPSQNKPNKNNFDSDDYTPNATGSGEKTDSVEDIFYALDTLNARAVAEKTIVHSWNDQASTSDGSRAFWPTWGKKSNGTANIVDEDGWLDTGTMGGCGGPVIMALIDLGVLNPSNANWYSAKGKDWWTGVDHLRNLGFDIPEYEDEDENNSERASRSQQTVVDDAQVGAWNWRSGLTVQSARDRTTEEIVWAYRTGEYTLIEALPTMGKSYSSIKGADITGEPTTILTGRGREEQYEQFEDWCDEFGLSSLVLPSVMADCGTFTGEHGEDWKQIVRGWYTVGATGREIHKNAERELGEPLPCESEPGEQCGFKESWEFETDEYDVLIGNYMHANVPSVTEGRTVVLDEFPGDSFVDELSSDMLASAISTFLSRHDDIPFTDFADLIENRHDRGQREVGLSYFEDNEVGRSGEEAFAEDGHALAPLATYTMLFSAKEHQYDSLGRLGNEFERAILPGENDQIGVLDRLNFTVYLLTPPSFTEVNGLVALDGTPTPKMWNLACGTSFDHRKVLDDNEYSEYVHSALGLEIHRTTGARKPYSGKSKYVNVKQDLALLEGIADREDELPGLLTTNKALIAYTESDAPVLETVGDYNNLPVEGSNEFKSKRVGAVVGSRHFGDRYVQLWGAYAGECVERMKEGQDDLSYTGIGQDIYQHMTFNQTLQAVMRFGRDANGATVYVHTDTLPDWVPIVGEAKVSTFTDKQRRMLSCVVDQEGKFARRDLDSPASKKWTCEFLSKLTDAGVLNRENKRGRYYYHHSEDRHFDDSHSGLVNFDQ